MLTKEHFETRVNKVGNGCWLWTGAVDSSGYGAVKANGKKRSAHRVAFELYPGPLPENKVVCHTCNVKLCVNPGHLYAGSRRDNMTDYLSVGDSRRRGKILMPKDVEEIRRRYASGSYTQGELAAAWGLTRAHVSDIVNGKCWLRTTDRADTQHSPCQKV